MDDKIALRNKRINQLSEACSELLELIADHLVDQEVATLREYLFVGELRMLANYLCADLIEENIPISEEGRGLVELILSFFDKPPYDPFIYLNDPSRTLERLKIHEA